MIAVFVDYLYVTGLLALYNSYRNVTTRSCVADRLNRLKCRVSSPARVDRAGFSFIHVVGNLLLLPAEGAREGEGRRGNYLSETQDVRSPARVPRSCLQCVRHPAWNSSVRLWSAVFCIKKKNASMQSDNGIFSLIFLCKETRYPRNASCCVLSCLPLLPCFIPYSPSIIQGFTSEIVR